MMNLNAQFESIGSQFVQVYYHTFSTNRWVPLRKASGGDSHEGLAEGALLTSLQSKIWN